MKIAVLLTCYNRREKTIRCLRDLFASERSPRLSLHVIVVDDNSSDGTVEAVRSEFPETEIVVGSGSLFWTRGMHMAFARAMNGAFDGYLWLNDDTTVFTGALDMLIRAYRASGSGAIYVGSTLDENAGVLTYGGLRSSHKLKPLAFTHMPPNGQLQECDTMNGNFVFIPYPVAQLVGNLDPHFAHAMGDIDYGLRARKLSVPVLLLPDFVGACSRNPVAGTFSDGSLPRNVRWRLMMRPKGLPPRSWLRLVRRHAGLLWPVYFLAPYLKAALR